MENFWSLIAADVASQGRECILAYPQVRTIPDIIRNSSIEVIEFPFHCRSWQDIWKGLSLIRRYNVRSIYLTDWPYLHWVYLLWRLAGVRRIVMHDHTPGDRPALHGIQATLKDTLHALGVVSATAYIAVSSYIGTRLRANARVPANRCTVVTNGIRMIERTHSNRAAVRAGLGVPDDAVLIALVSRATYYKGLDFAVRCIANLLVAPSGRRCVYAVHCGDGPDIDAFVALTRETQTDANFFFLGRRDDVKDILCAADIGFHPSHGEAMSLAVLEFMSAGLAVLASDLPSVCTAIRPNVDGLTYRHGSIDDATRELARLIDDAALRNRLGAAATVACREKYSLETMNATFRARVMPLI
jgi:glycosyltransferase involved in cell wall biosynthesis